MENDAPALNGPPALLEWAVLLLIPPAEREVVGGDLWEIYRSPHQYVFEALRTLPFVIASRMRRNANLPVLGLQGLMLFGCFGGFALTGLAPANWTYALVPTMVVLVGLLFFSIYQTPGQPSDKRAIFDTVLVTSAVIFFSVCVLSELAAAHLLKHITFMSPLLVILQLYMMPVMMPILCILRAGLVSGRESGQPVQVRDLSKEELALDYARFERRMARRNRLEIGILLGLASFAALCCLRMSRPYEAIALILIGGYVLTSIYLALEGRVRAPPAGGSFPALLSHYSGEMVRQHQIRRFIWWLWFTPLFFAIYSVSLERGIARDDPQMVVSGIVMMMPFFFFVASLNRERDGCTQEKIGGIARREEWHLLRDG